MIGEAIKKLGGLIKLLLILAVGFYVASLAYVISFSLSSNIPEHADAILVLGAKVNLDDTPSSSLRNRTEEAVRLYKDGRADYVMFTGGIGLGPEPESKVGKDLAVADGLPADKILIEKISHNTYGNLADIQRTAQEHNVKSVIVVSDRFHMARSVFVAKHFGFSPVSWSFPPIGYMDRGLIAWNYSREAAAMLVYVPRLLLGMGVSP